MDSVTIAHVSDLHVESEYYSSDLAYNVQERLSELEPDVLVITGDLTDNGYPREYTGAKDLTDRFKARRKLVVPGNHDARNMGYTVFEDVFGTRFPSVDVGWLKIQGIDSSEPDIDDGHIGRLAYTLVERSLGGREIKVVALHHHLIPVPGTGRERNIPVDAGDFLELIAKLGVNAVLSGHKHVPWMWSLNDMLLLNAGTATTLRVKAYIPPSFNILSIFRDGETSIETVESRTLRSRIVYKGNMLEGGKLYWSHEPK